MRATARSPSRATTSSKKDAPHKLLAGPELSEKDLYVSPTGEKLPKDGIVVEVPAGTILVSELPDRRNRQARRNRPARLVRAERRTRRCRATTSPNRSRNTAQINEPNVTFEFTDKGREAFQKSPARSPSAARRRRSARSAPKRRRRSPATSRSSSTTKSRRRPIINFAENPDGIDGRQGAQISGGFSSARRGAGTGDDAADRRPADQPAN